MESDIPETKKQKLQELYQSLNPAELKRTIDKKLALLVLAYKSKNKSSEAVLEKKINPVSLSFLISQPNSISLR